jgi:hypothetical protein
MTTQPSLPSNSVPLALTKVATFSRLRALAWSGNVLYGSRGYQLLSAEPQKSFEWKCVARFRPAAWRSLTSCSRLAYRLVRDGFHALSVLPSGHIVAAVPGAIVTLSPGRRYFEITHRITRGTRPLHITSTPDGRVYWGEYFDNKARGEVFIYASDDRGLTWNVAYTFPAGAIRHVHSIVYDSWQDCLWILTGDYERECRILRASCDLTRVESVLEGNQQARAVAIIPTCDALYFASDTPLEQNHIYRLNRRGELTRVTAISSSSIQGCSVQAALFFSTMAEPSETNETRKVHLYGSRDGSAWEKNLTWEKDGWPMNFFQYGNAFLPDGINTTDLLAVTTVAVKDFDLKTELWRVNVMPPVAQ